MAAAISREKVDFVLFPGDLAVGKKKGSFGTPSIADMTTRWDNWKTAAAPLLSQVPVYMVRGNHEAAIDNTAPAGSETAAWLSWIAANSGSTTTGIQALSSSLNYSFTNKNSLFVGLDEYTTWSSDTKTDVNLTFLNGQLSQPAAHRFVFTHQPIWYGDPSQVSSNADAFAAAMNGKVDLLFAGHVHLHDRVTKDGNSFQEILIGSGSAPLESSYTAPTDSTMHSLSWDRIHYGYEIVTVNDDSVTAEFKYLLDPTSSTSDVRIGDTFATPVPPAVLLLGSGLLGLVSWRKLKRVNHI